MVATRLMRERERERERVGLSGEQQINEKQGLKF